MLPIFPSQNVVGALDNVFGLVNQSIMHLDEAVSTVNEWPAALP